MRRGNILLGSVALGILAALFYLYGGHQTPSGQPPLAELNAANLGQLKNEFNARQPRILVLLSPT